MNILDFFKKRRERVLLKKLQNLYFGNRAFGNVKTPLDDWFERHYKDVLKSDELLSFIDRRPSLVRRFMYYVPQTAETQRVFCSLEPDLRGKLCLKYSGLFEMYIKYYGELRPEIEKMIFSDERTYSAAIILLRMCAYTRKS